MKNTLHIKTIKYILSLFLIYRKVLTVFSANLMLQMEYPDV